MSSNSTTFVVAKFTSAAGQSTLTSLPPARMRRAGRNGLIAFLFASVLLCSLAARANAGTIAVSIIDHNATTNEWSDADYGQLQTCVAQGLAAFGSYYKKTFNVLPVDQRSKSGIHINLTSASNCDGDPGVNNEDRQGCVSVNWCIQYRPANPLLCVEECVIHESAESLGPQLYDAAQGHTTVVNGCAMPDFIVPAKVQKATGFRDADRQMPL
jgi:hypothetical protein